MVVYTLAALSHVTVAQETVMPLHTVLNKAGIFNHDDENSITPLPPQADSQKLKFWQVIVFDVLTKYETMKPNRASKK